jgi:hypothetical protein
MKDNILYISGVLLNIILAIFFNKKKRINPDAILFFVIWSWLGTFLYIVAPLLRMVYAEADKPIKKEKENMVEERIYERFCKEQDILDKVSELEKIKGILKKYEPKKAAHEIYVMYGVDTMGNLNYNDHIKELLLIIGKK